MRMGKRKGMEVEKMSLSKPRRWHGFHERGGGSVVRVTVGVSFCLYQNEVSLEPDHGAGSALRNSFRQRHPGAVGPERASSLPGSGAGWLSEGGGASPGWTLTLSLAFWAA